MRVKRSTAKKKVIKKAPVNKKPQLVCQVCGYKTAVDYAYGREEEHPIYCCGIPMIEK